MVIRKNWAEEEEKRAITAKLIVSRARQDPAGLR
jgi:hypothetical protein